MPSHLSTATLLPVPPHLVLFISPLDHHTLAHSLVPPGDDLPIHEERDQDGGDHEDDAEDHHDAGVAVRPALFASDEGVVQEGLGLAESGHLGEAPRGRGGGSFVVETLGYSSGLEASCNCRVER